MLAHAPCERCAPSDEELARRLADLEAEMGEPVTLDRLTGRFRIFQRRRGHRHSTDDLLTAWYAVRVAPAAKRVLDLGTGIGSVGLSVLHALPDAALSGIEAQDVSFRLLRENLWANGLGERVRAIHGDLRSATPDEHFDLVTGSPPYFDVKTGILSPDSQRAHARFELRGDVSDYARAARRVLAPGGRFVFCFPTVQRARAEQACRDADVPLVSSRDVVPREGRAPLFTLFACRHPLAPPVPFEPLREAPLTVRDASGTHTAEMTAAHARFFAPEACQ
jgi:tRNA1(Val) A37 N6-methylase TrmN6